MASLQLKALALASSATRTLLPLSLAMDMLHQKSSSAERSRILMHLFVGNLKGRKKFLYNLNKYN